MKSQFSILVGLLLVVLAMAVSIGAQDQADDPAILCPAERFLSLAPDGKSIMDTLEGQVTTLRELAEADDMEAWFKQLSEFRAGLSFLEIECRGKRFNSQDEGLNPVVGPVAFLSGTWKASLKTDGLITNVTLTSVQGQCYEFMGLLFTSADQPVEKPSQTLFKTTGGCLAMIEIDQVGGTFWDLEFEPVTLDGQ